MKKNIHPNYNDIIVTCSCGNLFKIKSANNRNLNLDVCNKCHPFFTGKQRLIDTTGRVEKFNKRFNLYKNNKVS